MRWMLSFAASCGLLAATGHAQPQVSTGVPDCDAIIDEGLTFAQLQWILDGTPDVRPLAAPDGRIKICLCERVRVLNPVQSTHGAIRVQRDNIEIVGIGDRPNLIVNRRGGGGPGIADANSGIIVEGRYGFVLRNVAVETTGGSGIGVWLRDGAVADLVDGYTYSNHGISPIGIRIDFSALGVLRDFTITTPSGGNAWGIVVWYSHLGEMSDGYVFTSGSSARAIKVNFGGIGSMRRCVVEAEENTAVAQVHALELVGANVGEIDDCVLTTRRLDTAFFDVSFAIKVGCAANTPCGIDALLDSFVAAMGTQAVHAPSPAVIGDTTGTTFVDFWDGE